ncbi:MAG: hypothetical protein RIK87_10595 [Fuerstiella sp.]
MSRSAGIIMADSLQLGLGYARRMLTNVESAQFGRFASPGGQIIESNHPAFVYGHLSLYGPRILSELKMDAPAVPAGFQDAFSRNATCVDDPDGTRYPPMNEVTDFMFSGYQAVLDVLPSVPDEVFQQPNPNEAMAEKFPTMGSMHNFYVGGHFMIHMGQISAWRRMQGLGPA